MDVVAEGLSCRLPELEIVVEPQSKFRFRYKSEMTGKHGSLLGSCPTPDLERTGGSQMQHSNLLNDLNAPPSRNESGEARLGLGQDSGSSSTDVKGMGKNFSFKSLSPQAHSSGSRSGGSSSALGRNKLCPPASTSSDLLQGINPPGFLHSTNPGTNGAKLYPTVKLRNYGEDAIIRCTLVNELVPHNPHPHGIEINLVTTGGSGQSNGKECSAGQENDCHVDILVSRENDYTAVFQGLNIIYVGKKDMQKKLWDKWALLVDGDERKVEKLRDTEAWASNANLNTVCLYFEAFRLVTHANNQKKLIRICNPIASHPIHHNKSAQTGELRIVRIDKHTSYCTGDEEVFILVEKVDKHNIQIKFFQESDKGKEIWKAYGKFSKLDVHHQYAIVFKTPPYRSSDIDVDVDVWLQLERPSDGATSAPIRFKYKPIERLRKMPKRQDCRSGPQHDGPPPGGPSSPGRRPGGSDPGGYPGGQQGQHPLQQEPQNDLQGPSSSSQSARQGCGGQKFPCDLSTFSEKSDEYYRGKETVVAFNVALSVGEGLHSWAETSDFDFLLHRVRHLLCLVDASGDNSLHAAILNKQREPFLRILKIVTSSPDIASALNEQNMNNQTPLSLAVSMECPEFVEELVRHDVDLSIPNMDGDNPIHLCAKSNNLECLRALLGYRNVRAVINRFNYQSMTPLHLAVSSGHLEAADMICRTEASLTAQEGTFGRTALHLAVEKGSITGTVLLLQAAGESDAGNITNIQNYRGDTPLHVAASSGLVAICALLLYHGADCTIENFIEMERSEADYEEKGVGQTPIDLSANDEVVKILSGRIDSWEKIVKNCYHLLDSRYRDQDPKTISLDNLNIDSGIDIKDLSPCSK